MQKSFGVAGRSRAVPLVASYVGYPVRKFGL